MADLGRIVDSLRGRGRVRLAEVLHRHGERPLAEYASTLWGRLCPDVQIEPQLVRVLDAHLHRLGFDDGQRAGKLASLARTRTIQTATHLTASEGPSFHAIHRLASAAIPAGETYFIGAYSGVPFGNSAWPGCLNFSDHLPLDQIIAPPERVLRDLRRAHADRSRDGGSGRLSLVPARWRDARVGGTLIPTKLERLWPYVTEPIRRLAPTPVAGYSFPDWMNLFAIRTLQTLLPGQDVVYLDLNAVVRDYLLLVMDEPAHPLHRIHFDPAVRRQAERLFADATWWTASVVRNGRPRMEVLRMKGGALVGDSSAVPSDPAAMRQALERGELMPGKFPLFTALAAVNGLTCFGSFEQIEYLARFHARWSELGVFSDRLPPVADVSRLTSGRCFDVTGRATHPLDLILDPSIELQRVDSLVRLMMPILTRWRVDGI
jgi:hypothetical protein